MWLKKPGAERRRYMMTEIEKATEFSRRRNLKGVTVRHMATKRTLDVCLSLCGKDLGSMTHVYTRGKVTQTLIVLPTL